MFYSKHYVLDWLVFSAIHTASGFNIILGSPSHSIISFFFFDQVQQLMHGYTAVSKVVYSSPCGKLLNLLL